MLVRMEMAVMKYRYTWQAKVLVMLILISAL